jgi:MFS superfamily sulfate permease-like transporter
VAEQSGAKSQVTGLVGAGVVALLLLVFNSLLADLPQTALAAVVIAAALSLADVSILRRYAHVRRSALALSLVATVGVVLLGVLQGILIAVVLSILLFFKRAGGRTGAQSPGSRVGTARSDIRRAREAPGCRLPVEAPLFFANSAIFLEQCATSSAEDPLGGPVAAVTDVDVTAADMLQRLDVEPQRPGRAPGIRRAPGPAS